MNESHLHERRFHGGADSLRSPERVALLEVDRVVALSLDGLSAVSVLDVGTGTGIFAEAFSRQGLQVTGIDTNPRMLEIARGCVPGGKFKEDSAEKIHFDRGSFDLVFLGHVLHETDDPVGALREARRVARFRVAVLEWPDGAEDPLGPPLEHRLKPEQVEEFAGKAGFRYVESIVLAHMNYFRLSG